MAAVVRAATVLVLIAVNVRTLLGAFGAAGTALGEQLAGSGTAVGLTSTISVALMAVGAPISALLSRRRGIDTTVVIALLATSGALALLSLGAVPATMAAAVIGGLAAGVLGALLPALARTWLPNALGTAVGVMLAATSAGLAIASVVVSWSLDRLDSWSPSTLALALLALTSAAIYRRVSQRPRSDREAEEVPEGGSASRPGATPKRALPRWAAVLTVFIGLQSFVLFAQIAWLAPTLEATGATAGFAGSMLGLFSSLQVVAALTVTHHAQRRGHLGQMLVAASILTALGATATLVPLLDGGSIPWWAISAMSLGHGASFALANLAIAERSPDPGAAARTGAVVMFLSQGVAALGPVVVGALHDGPAGLGGAWLLLVVLCAAQSVVALVYLFTGRGPGLQERSRPSRTQRKSRPSARR